MSAVTDFLLAILLLAGLPIALVVAGLFGPTSEIVETFAWVLAVSFVATGLHLILVAPAEACEQDKPPPAASSTFNDSRLRISP